MIEVKNLNKSFNGNAVLQDINIVFEEGKCNLIIGESGSGKTVLTKCMVGLFEPDNGEILYHNRNFVKMGFKDRREIRKEIGMLFQGSALFDSLTVEENIMFPLSMFSEMSLSEKQDRVNDVLKQVNLTNRNKLYPNEISGGQKKRVGIARAIAMNPQYLFCDEPNSGLDPHTSALIDKLIEEITYEYKITTVVITHDMNSVVEIGDHINFLYGGKVWWQGNKQEVLDTDNEALNKLVYASKLLQTLKKR
ncbi:MAG: ATP-binding cassette domain-containing protein [Bacteroidia bacterium]|nr:ATP-binding cassette domain-containing protein [Bacteroidia bacterium]